MTALVDEGENGIDMNIPQMGKSPKVIPNAAENANCVGSAPLSNQSNC